MTVIFRWARYPKSRHVAVRSWVCGGRARSRPTIGNTPRLAAHNPVALLLVPMNVQRSSAGSSMIAKSRNIRWLTRFAAVEARSSHRAMVWRAWPVTRAVAEMLTPSTRAGSRPGRIPDERSEGRCTLSPCACCPVPRRPCSGTASVGPTSSETSRGPRC